METDMPFSVVVISGGRVIGLHTSEESSLIGADCSEVWEPSPALGTRDYITLTKGGSTIDLRNPHFGNTESLHTGLIRHENPSGIIIVGHPTYKYMHRVFNFECSELTVTEKENFEAFVKIAAGYQITLVDHEDVTRTGVLTDPQYIITKEGRGCRYTVSFNFEELP
jgi:hypothetical protein